MIRDAEVDIRGTRIHKSVEILTFLDYVVRTNRKIGGNSKKCLCKSEEAHKGLKI